MEEPLTVAAENLEVTNYTEAEETVAMVEDYKETDIFAWANNLVQYVDDLKIELFFFNKNGTCYRIKLIGDVSRQLRPLFIDGILEYMLDGIEKGLIVRGFEEAEKEENVLQRTKLKNVIKLVDTLRWIKTQRQDIETFVDEEHDIKRMKGVIAHCSHKEMDQSFYIIKSVPTSQIMKGHTAWMLKDGTFRPFDRMSALKIPGDNHLLVTGQDVFVFNQAKLKQLFGYDAKAASIAIHKVKEIESHFKLSFSGGVTLQSLVEGRHSTIRKLQKIVPSLVKQEELVNHAEEIGVNLMTDDTGAIIIMDDKDLTTFVNLLNDDYVESPMTGQRYEIIRKKPLKPPSDDDLLKEVS